jgi:hypothetical protein
VRVRVRVRVRVEKGAGESKTEKITAPVQEASPHIANGVNNRWEAQVGQQLKTYKALIYN